MTGEKRVKEPDEKIKIIWFMIFKLKLLYYNIGKYFL